VQQRLQVHAVCDSELLKPTPSTWPSLGSAVRSTAPLEARVLLVVGDEGWPLLAYANRGLGRVAAFGAELTTESGREFREASEFPGWLGQWLAATSVASDAVEAAELREQSDVTPPAPVPADVRWLHAVAGGEPQLSLASSDPSAPAPPRVGNIGREAVSQVPPAAPWLLAMLLLLAVAERLTSWYALLRGRS